MLNHLCLPLVGWFFHPLKRSTLIWTVYIRQKATHLCSLFAVCVNTLICSSDLSAKNERRAILHRETEAANKHWGGWWFHTIFPIVAQLGSAFSRSKIAAAAVVGIVVGWNCRSQYVIRVGVFLFSFTECFIYVTHYYNKLRCALIIWCCLLKNSLKYLILIMFVTFHQHSYAKWIVNYYCCLPFPWGYYLSLCRTLCARSE